MEVVVYKLHASAIYTTHGQFLRRSQLKLKFIVWEKIGSFHVPMIKVRKIDSNESAQCLTTSTISN